jgi:hypothetical protein
LTSTPGAPDSFARIPESSGQGEIMGDNFKEIFAGVAVSVIAFVIYDFFARPALEKLLNTQGPQ